MIVLLGRRRPPEQAQASGHPEVQDEVPVPAIEQKVLAASPQRANLAPRQTLYLLLYSPAKPWLPHGDAGDETARQLRRDTAQRHLNFRQLGHLNLGPFVRSMQGAAARATRLVRAIKYT